MKPQIATPQELDEVAKLELDLIKQALNIRDYKVIRWNSFWVVCMDRSVESWHFWRLLDLDNRALDCWQANQEWLQFLIEGALPPKKTISAAIPDEGFHWERD